MKRQLRRRRPAEEARTAILDAAERQLIERGPDRIRLQEIGADVGISHSAVLHHFGNRAALVAAVVERSLGALRDELVGVLTGKLDNQIAASIFQRVFDVLANRDNARTLAWLYLTREGKRTDVIGHGKQVRQIAALVHERRLAVCRAAKRQPLPSSEDTMFTVALASFALFGHAIAGEATGIDSSKFLPWMTHFIVDHLEHR